MRDAAIALEGELDVRRRHWLAVVEAGALTHHEIVGAPVLRRGNRLRKARREWLAGHRLDHRIVQCIEHHEWCDDARRFRRLEPSRCEGDMDAPGQLVRRSRHCQAGATRKHAKTGSGQQLATADRRLASGRIRFAAFETRTHSASLKSTRYCRAWAYSRSAGRECRALIGQLRRAPQALARVLLLNWYTSPRMTRDGA